MRIVAAFAACLLACSSGESTAPQSAAQLGTDAGDARAEAADAGAPGVDTGSNGDATGQVVADAGDEQGQAVTDAGQDVGSDADAGTPAPKPVDGVGGFTFGMRKSRAADACRGMGNTFAGNECSGAAESGWPGHSAKLEFGGPDGGLDRIELATSSATDQGVPAAFAHYDAFVIKHGAPSQTTGAVDVSAMTATCAGTGQSVVTAVWNGLLWQFVCNASGGEYQGRDWERILAQPPR